MPRMLVAIVFLLTLVEAPAVAQNGRLRAPAWTPPRPGVVPMRPMGVPSRHRGPPVPQAGRSPYGPQASGRARPAPQTTVRQRHAARREGRSATAPARPAAAFNRAAVPRPGSPAVAAAGVRIGGIKRALRERRAFTRTQDSVALEAGIREAEGNGRIDDETGLRIVYRTGEGTSATAALERLARRTRSRIESSGDGVRMIWLPGGGSASARPTSSDGSPTLQITRKGRTKEIKIRFDRF